MPQTLTFPPPSSGRLDLLIIAGEHSGDQHAGRMVADLRHLRPDLKIAAFGGEQLAGAGAQLLYDFTQHSVVGIFEVLKSYRFFKELFKKTWEWVVRYQPRHLCFVDYPGFNLRMAQRLYDKRMSRKGGGEIGLYYYISPQIWAWKAKRRFKMARLLDALAVIFPFEVEWYKETGLPVRFVGHPFISSDHTLPVTYRSDGAVLLLPGSRRIAVSRIFPVMADAFELLLECCPQERAVVIYPDVEVKRALEATLRLKSQVRGHIDLIPFGQAIEGKVVLTSSGTMSLACALAGIPGAIAYRAHPLTYLLGRMLVQVPYLGIANLLLKEQVYSEYIQGRATPRYLFKVLQEAIDSREKSDVTQAAARKLRVMLSCPKEASAAAWLAELMREQCLETPSSTNTSSD